jgi:hypothetical protein
VIDRGSPADITEAPDVVADDVLADDVLEVWGDARELLDRLPPLSPDHETVRLAVTRLQGTYQILTDRFGRSSDAVIGSEAVLRDAEALIAKISAKLLGDQDPENDRS